MKSQFRKNLVVTAIAMVAVTTAVALVAEADDQYSEWSAPVNLGPTLNSAGAEQGPAVSRDGRSMYFHWTSGCAPNLPGCQSDIYFSQRATINDPWGPPQVLGPNINTPFNEANPALSPDGHSLYFQANRPGGCGGADLYVSRRHNRRDPSGWQPAVNLGCVVNTSAQEQQPSVLEDDSSGAITLYFQSNRPGGMGGFDIYASTLQPDETFGEPTLVAELSSSWNDNGPEIRRDGLEMFLSSDRPGTVGLEDLWVSTRTSTSDPWSEPQHLGSVVNGIGHDSHPSLSFDGTVLYFASAARPENIGGQGFFDLWAVTRTKLKPEE